MNQFGYVVKQYLLDNNIKQQEIVDKMGKSKNAISQSLTRNNITLETMSNIADALDCELSIQLVPRNNNDN